MKLFIIRFLLFSLGLLLLFPIKTVYLLKNDKYKKLILGSEIYVSQNKSKQRNKKVKTLIIGDSVGRQLFDNSVYNDTIYSLACNQAISMAGHYFLLEDFLTRNPEVEKVMLIYVPKYFKNNLDQQYTFQYFLKPFYNNEYKNRFSSSIMEQVRQVPFHYLSQFPPILTSNWTPDWDFSKATDNYYLSPISMVYLTKMVNLCHEHSVKFILLPPPTRSSYMPRIADFSKNIHYSGYDLKDYFSRVEYIADSCFLDDVHLKHPEKYKQPYLEILNHL